MIGNLDKYLQFQAAESLGKGDGNSGMDMGMGFAMANKMADTLDVGSTSNQTATQATPPPLPQNTWHVAQGDSSTGPHSMQAVTQMIGQGQLNSTTLVWRAGMENWQAAADVAELNELLGSQTPPPLPGQN